MIITIIKTYQNLLGFPLSAHYLWKKQDTMAKSQRVDLPPPIIMVLLAQLKHVQDFLLLLLESHLVLRHEEPTSEICQVQGGKEASTFDFNLIFNVSSS